MLNKKEWFSNIQYLSPRRDRKKLVSVSGTCFFHMPQTAPTLRNPGVFYLLDEPPSRASWRASVGQDECIPAGRDIPALGQTGSLLGLSEVVCTRQSEPLGPPAPH